MIEMKTHLVTILLVTLSALHCSAEVTWDPSQPYNSVREGESSWTHSIDARRCEYGLKYLLEAHKDAVEVQLSSESKVSEGLFSQEELVRIGGIAGNLGEVIRCAFSESLKYFQEEPNEDLLLMLLYHFEVYCYGGDSCEAWPGIIKPLQKLDPELSKSAKELAKDGKARLFKLKD
jgi:hypothetical protein